jgi:cytochrome c
MNTPVSNALRALSTVAAAMLLGASIPAIAAVDADAAEKLAKKSDCFKCHAVDKEKKGPSFKKIAAKYKGKPDGEEKAVKNMTTSPKVKLDDGTEEEHKVVKSKDMAEIKNLANWILSQ